MKPDFRDEAQSVMDAIAKHFQAWESIDDIRQTISDRLKLMYNLGKEDERNGTEYPNF